MTLRDLLNKYPGADLSTVYIYYMNNTYDKVLTTIPGYKFFSGDIDIDIPQLETATYDWKVDAFFDDPEKGPIEERKLSITLADRVLDFEFSKKVIENLKKQREENSAKDKNLYKFIHDLIFTVAYADIGIGRSIVEKAKDLRIDQDWFKNSVCYTRFQVLTYVYGDDILADDFYRTLSYEILNGKLTLSQVLYPTTSDEENFFKLFEEMLDDDISEDDLLDYCGEEDPDCLPSPRQIWDDEEILIKTQKLFQELECKIRYAPRTLFKQGVNSYKDSCKTNYHCALVQTVAYFNGKTENYLLEQQNFEHIKKYIDIKEEK